MRGKGPSRRGRGGADGEGAAAFPLGGGRRRGDVESRRCGAGLSWEAGLPGAGGLAGARRQLTRRHLVRHLPAARRPAGAGRQCERGLRSGSQPPPPRGQPPTWPGSPPRRGSRQRSAPRAAGKAPGPPHGAPPRASRGSSPAASAAMALKMVKGSIDRMFDKNLQDLVRGIRNHKEDEVSPARGAGPVWLGPSPAPVPTRTPIPTRTLTPTPASAPASSSFPKPRARLEPCRLATGAAPRPLSL